VGENKLSRRDILTGGAIIGGTVLGAALTQSPVEKILEAMSLGVIRKAQAESSGVDGVRNYINIIMPGAPSRYAFDHWLRTNTTDPGLQYNPMVSTKFVNSGGRAAGVINEYFNYRGLLVPHMFSHNVYNSAGAQRPLTDLLNHMLVIRGYGTGFDGHPFNATAQQSPVGGVASVGGMAADESVKTFEAVQWPDRGDFGSFASLNGKALNKLSGAPLTNLMEGFGGPAAGRTAGRSVKDRNIAAYELAQARLNAYAKSDSAGASIVAKNLTNATALMKKGIADVDSFWGPAVARYRAVIENSLRQSGLAGISDMALISTQDVTWKLHVAAGNFGLVLSADYDLRSALPTVQAPDTLAEGLALAEYTLKKGLVTSLDLQAGHMNGWVVKQAGTGVVSSQQVIHDMHESGAAAGLFYATTYYRGLSAGLLELIDQLKGTTINGKTVWSETVVQLISDFGRSARADGSGSDHGFNQMVTSVFSGAFSNGPFVVGNIAQAGHGGGYTGTQGIGVAISGYNQNGRPTPVAASSTVAALLRLPKNHYENLAAPLVKLNGDQLVAVYPGKIVA
jgi:hypothetical protein